MSSLRFPFTQAHTGPAARVGLNSALWAAWLWLYWPLADYLHIIFSREDFRTNQIVLIGITFLLLTQIQRQTFRPQLDVLPRLAWLPLTLVLGCSLLYLLVERFLDVHTLAATLAGLATYGLLGLWLSPERWRGGLPAALLLIGALPFGEHMQTFIGYPMRIVTADFVQAGLTAVHVPSVGLDTILVFENGVSQVDLPCSGVKSLWTGMLFLLAATWVERRPINGRWLGTAVLFSLLLFVVNLLRVGILVTVGIVAELPLLAEMLHIPLGVLGFVAACAAAVVLLRKTAVSHHPSAISHQSLAINPPPIHHSPFSSLFALPSLLFPLLLLLTIAVMALAYTPRPQTGLTQTPPAWQFPADLQTEAMPLKPDEIEWLTRDGAESADRRRFVWGDVSGSMILITSRTWRAHHRPERCFEVYGLTLNESSTHLVAQAFPLRLVSLGKAGEVGQYTAVYWFQSASHTTDDYATRIWDDLSLERERWVLVSVVFDGVVDPQTAEIQAFYTVLHQAVGNQLSAMSH